MGKHKRRIFKSQILCEPNARNMESEIGSVTTPNLGSTQWSFNTKFKFTAVFMVLICKKSTKIDLGLSVIEDD